jgi:hypothetical protein
MNTIRLFVEKKGILRVSISVVVFLIFLGVFEYLALLGDGLAGLLATPFIIGADLMIVGIFWVGDREIK